MISSDLVASEGHKNRFKFVNRMIGHFKQRMDVFGRGYQFIEDKYDGLAPYKYSVAIENSVHQGYFSEKLVDCFLAETMPIYFGCPNITDYIPAESLILIDIDDYQKSIALIEQSIEDNLFHKNYQFIMEAKELILNKLQIIPALSDILNNYAVDKLPQKVKIKPLRKFTQNPMHQRITNRIKIEFDKLRKRKT